MDTTIIQNNKVWPALIGSCLMAVAAIYSPSSVANSNSTTPTVQAPGIQLAYYVDRFGNPHYRHKYHRNTYWTNWRYAGRGCARSCLVSRWDGRVIHCKRRCY